MKNGDDQQPTRFGYTLMEMMIVQGVLVLLVGMSWPALRSPLAKNRLLDAAKQVRIELVRARLKAIDTGVAQQFRYQLGTGRFVVVPASVAVSTNGFRDQSTGISNHGSNASDVDGDSSSEEVEPTTLSEGIQFVDPEAEEGSSIDAEPTTDSLDEETWSEPIFFRPNGRSNSARIALAGERGFRVGVALRGLTGAIKVGEIERSDDSQ